MGLMTTFQKKKTVEINERRKHKPKVYMKECVFFKYSVTWNKYKCTSHYKFEPLLVMYKGL